MDSVIIVGPFQLGTFCDSVLNGPSSCAVGDGSALGWVTWLL